MAYVAHEALPIRSVNVMRIPLFGTQDNMVDMNEMEGIINENIETLIDINEDIGYLADHGTPTPASTGSQPRPPPSH